VRRRRLPRIVARVLLVLSLAAGLATAGDFDLGRYRGKVVLVDFWASWCAPCRQSFPWLNSMQQRYADQGLVVIGLNVDRAREDADRFLRDVPAQFEIAYDPEGVLAKRYDLMGMPSSLLFDRSGRLVRTHVGFKLADREAREAQVRKLLEERP
jgi:thiol-disulfide isomerase/thioredoxin